jgi:hypothetical protein
MSEMRANKPVAALVIIILLAVAAMWLGVFS